MDMVFHAASAGMLAYGLGERRSKQLWLAALVGAAPDTLWLLAYARPEYRCCYSLLHSAVFNTILCALLCRYNWRVAFGAWLHVLIDVFTHSSTTHHLFYPFAGIKLFEGIDWWEWPGLLVWASLWLLLIALFFIIFLRKGGRCEKEEQGG